MTDMMNSILEFDPFGDYPLDDLLNVTTPRAPRGFDDFWQGAYRDALAHYVSPTLHDTGRVHEQWKIYQLSFNSTNAITIKGCLLVPLDGKVTRAFVVGHGYAGRDGPDYHLLFPEAALYFPCCRGISDSICESISDDPYWHVIHDIDNRDNYIIRGCVEDIWLSVSALEKLFWGAKGHIGLLGISFSGGVGMLALAQDKRIKKAHFNQPTFGHYALRLRIPTYGSGKSIQDFYQRDPYTLIRTLRYYDAAFAASRVTVPVHFALALRDCVVTPPGQFAIYNQVTSEKHHYLLDAGHENYPNQEQQFAELNTDLIEFFRNL